MTTIYKVWLEIERIDNFGGEHEKCTPEQVPLDIGSTASFSTLEGAIEFCRRVNADNSGEGDA